MLTILTRAVVVSVLDSTTYKRIYRYAEAADIPIDCVISEAINEWMDSTGDLILAELSRCQRPCI